MGIIQIIGVITCIISPEPIVKRYLVKKTSEKIKLLVTFFLGLIFLIFIYKNFPGMKFDDKIANALFGLIKLFISIMGAFLVFYLLMHLKFVQAQTIETFLHP